MIQEEDVAGLLAAEVQSVPHHGLDHVAIADGRAQEIATEIAQGDLETEVGHHGRDHRALDEGVGAQQFAGRDREDLVAVHDRPLLVDEQAAVGVAVERDADVRAPFAHPRLQILGVERPAIAIDVLAVGLAGERRHARTEFLDHLGSDPVTGTVGRVHDDLHAVERQVAGKAVLGEDVIPAEGVIDAEGLADLGSGRAQVVDGVREHQFLDLRLQVVGELEAVGGEELDAVVLEGIVRGGDDDARVGTQAACEERDARRRHRADEQHVHAHRADARSHGRLQHVARDAGVLADQDLVAPRTRPKDVRDGAAEAQRHLRGHRVLVGDPANAVGAEESPLDLSLAHCRPSAFPAAPRVADWTSTSPGSIRTSSTPCGSRTLGRDRNEPGTGRPAVST